MFKDDDGNWTCKFCGYISKGRVLLRRGFLEIFLFCGGFSGSESISTKLKEPSSSTLRESRSTLRPNTSSPAITISAKFVTNNAKLRMLSNVTFTEFIIKMLIELLISRLVTGGNKAVYLPWAEWRILLYAVRL